MPSAALVQFRPLSLNPTPHTTGAAGQTSFPRHFCHLCHRDGVAQIPAHTPHGDVAWIVSPFERIGCGDGHISPYQIGTRVFATEPFCLIRYGESRTGLHDVTILLSIPDH